VTTPIIGIDLGTTNSVVSVCDEHGTTRVLADKTGNKIQPSVVAFPPNGKVLVGAEAKERKVIDPQNTIYSVKRLMGRTSQSREVIGIRKRVPYRISEGDNQQPIIKTRAGDFAPADISAIILDHMRNIAADQLAGEISESLDRAVVTVPANFNEAQRAATATAGAIAGLAVVRILNEPTAAALAYGHKKRLKQTVAVYDFGGGTFDISILKLDGDVFEVIGTAGDTMLGGDDFDERVVESLRRQFLAQNRVDLSTDPQAMMRLRQLAETVKIELSRTVRSRAKLEEIAYGAGGSPLTLEADMRREEFEAHVRDLIERTFPVCEEALKLAQVRTADITDVVLVGGTSRIPLVRNRVADFFQQEPRTDVNPDEAVAIGAGIQAEAMRITLDDTSASVTVPGADLDADTLNSDQTLDIAGSIDDTLRRHTPPPVPRTTIQGQAPVLPSESQEASDRRAALARVQVRKADQASVNFREVARDGAIKDPNHGRSLTADDTLDALTRQRGSHVPSIFDVTPHSLGIATVGGYCEILVRRNSQLPVTRERVFTNARDGQVQVRIKVCQGESRRLVDNTVIGDLVLDGLPARRRGETKIQVNFEIDESGMLNVTAMDQATGRQQHAAVNILGAQSAKEIEAASERIRQLRP